MKIKFFKSYLITAFIAAFMAIILALSPAIHTVSAAKKIQTYLSEVIVIKEDQIDSAKADGYTIMSNTISKEVVNLPIYEGKEEDTTKTYLAYKTTEDPNDAITDIRFMNMKGGYSFEEYSTMLKSAVEDAKKSAATIWGAVKEFRDNYKANLDTAIYAKTALNIYSFDDVLDNGKPIKLGDLLLNETLILDKDSEYLATLFLESNTNILNGIYDALAVACSKTVGGDSFLDTLSKITPSSCYDRTDLNYVVGILKDDAERVKESVEFYDNSAKHYEDFNSQEEIDAYIYGQFFDDKDNNTDYYKKWMEGYAAKTTLKEISYSGIGLSGCSNLYDFVMNANKRDYDWYPLVASMSEGTRACAFLGLLNLIKDASLDPDHLYDNYNDIMAIEETKKIAEEGISVFYDVDREIYKDGMVAMTGTAVWGSKSGDDSWQLMQDEANKDFLKSSLTRSILKYTACGLGGISAVGIGLVVHFSRASYVAEVANTGAIAAEVEIDVEEQLFNAARNTWNLVYEKDSMWMLLSEQIDDAMSSAFDGMGSQLRMRLQLTQRVYESELRSITETTAKTSTVANNVSKTVSGAVKVSAVFLAVAVIMLIVTLVLYFLLQEEPVLVYEEYAEIPAMLCDYRPVYIGKKIDNDTKKYVYYKVAENPYGVAEKSLFGDTEEIKILPENKKPAQDIYNWELKGNREWLCVYTTKDVKAGFPIKANSLKLDGNKTLSGYSTASLFDSSDGLDLMKFYNGSINTNPNLSSSQKDSMRYSNVYLHYEMDMTVERGTLEEKIIDKNTTLASAISNGATWGMFLGCAALGIVVSLIVVKRKKN